MSDYSMDQEYLINEGKSSLSSDDEQLTQTPFRLKQDRYSRSSLFSWTAIITHASIFLTYTILVAALAGWLHRSSGSQKAVAYTPFTPDPEAVMFDHDHSIYVGEPSEELEDAWNNLLMNNNVRITDEEISNIPGRAQNAIALPDGGYYATINAFHNLHCIKRLHHFMYEDYYFPNITHREHAANEFHNHHCLDMLRQTVMCQADMQLLTMKWQPDTRYPTANWSAPHQCANWNQVNEWASSRRINNLMAPGYLNHPTLGPAYPGGRGSAIGETLPQDDHHH